MNNYYIKHLKVKKKFLRIFVKKFVRSFVNILAGVTNFTLLARKNTFFRSTGKFKSRNKLNPIRDFVQKSKPLKSRVRFRI